MARIVDQIIEDSPGNTLAIQRTQPLVRWATFKEFFAAFDLQTPEWSQLRFEKAPARIVLLSTPTGRKQTQLLLTPEHQLLFTAGEEFGGPLSCRLEVTLANEVCFSVSFRVKTLVHREDSKDFFFRCANILGFLHYQLENDDSSQLRIRFVSDVSSAQVAYRESSDVTRPVPEIRRQAQYQPSSVSHQLAKRADDDSYWIFSWEPSSLIHLVSSDTIDWDTPRTQWKPSELREVIFDITQKNLSYETNGVKKNYHISSLTSLYLAREAVGAKCRTSLFLMVGGVRLLLAQSAPSESHLQAFRTLSWLATELASTFNLDCYSDLFPSGEQVFLQCVAPGLFFAGKTQEHAIAYVPKGNHQYQLHSVKTGSFTSIAPGYSTWLVRSEGDIYEYNEHNSQSWTHHRPLGKTLFHSIAQQKNGDSLAVGNRGRVFFKRADGHWNGITENHLPLGIHGSVLVGVIPYQDRDFLVLTQQGALFQVNVRTNELNWTMASIYEQQASGLFCAEGGVWIAFANGQLSEVSKQFSLTTVLSPKKGMVRAICQGEPGMFFAASDDGRLWKSPFGNDFSEFYPKTIEAAYVALSPQPEEMTDAGLWSLMTLEWVDIQILPKISWQGIAYHRGRLFLVGDDCLLRVSTHS